MKYTTSNIVVVLHPIMPLFCRCSTKLDRITTSDSLFFKCAKCQHSEVATAADTMVFKEEKGTNLIMYKTILQNAGRDPVNPKVLKQCPQCPNKIAKQVRLGEQLRLINICTNPSCGKQWIEGFGEMKTN